MVKFKLYRWLRERFGARSYFKDNEKGQKIRGLVSHSSPSYEKMLKEMGFEEEWPR